jgi:hypothetical protein
VNIFSFLTSSSMCCVAGVFTVAALCGRAFDASDLQKMSVVMLLLAVINFMSMFTKGGAK